MRTILHCDLNNFFASVECKMNPQLKNVPVAVCGSVEERRGIVLAKNELAKACGVKTAEAIWQAQQKCKNLVIVPPQMHLYEEYSKKVYEIYTRYTDMIEPFGIDECWLDVTGSIRLFGSGEEIANKIRETVKKELGLTISVGVSFNKIFAKLGSDMKKPDAVTVIPYESFREKIWGLPCSDMIGVGRATKAKLDRYYIKTLGQLAKTPVDFLQRTFGVMGIELWKYANGKDNSPVCHQNYKREIKSVGNSITLPYDLKNDNDVWLVMFSLAKSVCERMRKDFLCAKGVSIWVKTPDLHSREFQTKLDSPVRTSIQLATAGFELFKENYKWETDVRAIGIRANSVISSFLPRQLNFLEDSKKIENLEKIEDAVDSLKKRYGKNVVIPLSLKNVKVR